MRPDANAPVFVDATLFMGMHSEDEAVRTGCKAFFAGRLAAGEAGRVLMNWEQVGRCDDLVWGYGRRTQDEYYPFMDVLHTDLAVNRVPYDEDDVRRAFTSPGLGGLPAHERLLLAQVVGRGGVLHTASPRLAEAAGGLPVVPVAPRASAAAPAPLVEPTFPAYLEDLYQRSLVLTVVSANL
ncbi:DUF6190 family protein [Streptomyces sp. NPDC101490]|uniref:DUF6190 family protein n=1 Tax=Streptomyces sp. NPDC101490 TaxID=3366143 RepID=UPI00382C11A1